MMARSLHSYEQNIIQVLTLSPTPPLSNNKCKLEYIFKHGVNNYIVCVIATYCANCENWPQTKSEATNLEKNILRLIGPEPGVKMPYQINVAPSNY